MVSTTPVTELIAALARDDLLVDPVMQRVRAEIASYAVVPSEQLMASLERNRQRAVRTLRDGSVPVAEHIWEAETTTLERLRHGVPIEDLMAGFRISISAIQERLMTLSEQMGVDVADVVKLTRLLWTLSDVFAAQAAKTYREHAVASAVAEQRLHDEWLVHLLAGTVDERDTDRILLGLGLSSEVAYVPFCARWTGPGGPTAGQAALEASMRDALCLVVPSEQRLIGLLAHEPAPVDSLVLAVGAQAAPRQVAAGFALAQRVLDAADDVNPGIYSLERLGWRLGVTPDPWLLGHLERTYLVPLQTSRGQTLPILEALRAYLAHDRNIARAAASLHVHVNTLRYRLSRFEHLTGTSLAATDTVIEVAWLLQGLDRAFL
jgi:putative transposase